jgi:hypothetical protein
MRHKGDEGNWWPDGRLVRFVGGKGTVIYTDTGKRLGRLESLAIDPVAGRIVLVMIAVSHIGPFGRKQLVLPWTAFALDESTGRLLARTEEGPNKDPGGRSSLVVRRDPARPG